MKKKSPSASPHPKPTRAASRSSRARRWIRFARIDLHRHAGGPPEAKIEEDQRGALDHVIDRIVVEVRRVDRDSSLLEHGGECRYQESRKYQGPPGGAVSSLAS